MKKGSKKWQGQICRVANEIFEEHKDIKIGKGIIVRRQKSGKPKEVLKHLRPVTLLPTRRKMPSIITIKRIKARTESFMTPEQSAYRSGRSTTDIVWTHKWLIAKSIKYQIQVFITGIDMTPAFDTIQRQRMMDIYSNIANEDQRRMIRALMTGTTLEIKTLDHTNQKSFESNVGSPQGDGISGKNFTLFLESALSDAREKLFMRSEYDYSLPPPTEAE